MSQSYIKQYMYDYMVPAKLLYLFVTISIYSTHTFTAKYFFSEWKLSMKEFGFVSALTGFNFFGASGWTLVADRTNSHKPVLIICAFMYAASFTMLRWQPFDPVANHASKMAYTVVLYGISNLFVSALFPLLDNRMMCLLATHPNFTKERFGRLRLWSSIGHTLVTIVNGTVMDELKKTNPENEYDAMFMTLGSSTFIFIILAYFSIPSQIRSNNSIELDESCHPRIEKNQNLEAQADPPLKPQSHSKLVLTLLSNPNFIFFLTVILVAGYPRSIMSYFLAFYMEQDMDQSKLVISLTHISRAISEIAVYFFSKQLFRIFGVYWMLAFAQMVGIIRIAMYGILPTSGDWFYLSFVIELLKGVNTACIVSSAIKIISEMAPKGAEATAQGCFSGVYNGVASGIAGALGGYFAHEYGFRTMFVYTAIVSTIALGMYFIKYAFVDQVICMPSVKKMMNKQSLKEKQID